MKHYYKLSLILFSISTIAISCNTNIPNYRNGGKYEKEYNVIYSSLRNNYDMKFSFSVVSNGLVAPYPVLQYEFFNYGEDTKLLPVWIDDIWVNIHTYSLSVLLLKRDNILNLKKCTSKRGEIYGYADIAIDDTRVERNVKVSPIAMQFITFNNNGLGHLVYVRSDWRKSQKYTDFIVLCDWETELIINQWSEFIDTHNCYEYELNECYLLDASFKDYSDSYLK